MGILIIGEKPNPSSGYDQWRVYKCLTQSGSYSLVATQDITDMTYYDANGTTSMWYKTAYYNSDTTDESDKSTEMKGLSTTYTSVAKVTSFLQVAVRSDSTSPTTAEVSEVISRIEDEIDQTTGHAWRTRYSGTHTGMDTSARYIYADLDNRYEYTTGIPVYLPNRMLRDLDADEGDEIGYWSGSAWEDWIADKTEGRANDFWLDYDKGMLYVKSMYIWRRPVSIRVKYRYGDALVPRDIERASTLLVACDIISGMESKAAIIPEGSDALRQRDKIEIWQKQADTIIQRHKEFKMPPSLM